MNDRDIERWMTSLSKELIAEARELLEQDHPVEARIVLALATALMRAGGKVP